MCKQHTLSVLVCGTKHMAGLRVGVQERYIATMVLGKVNVGVGAWVPMLDTTLFIYVRNQPEQVHQELH